MSDPKRDARIVALLHTALFDTGGESVEGAFVDHWESNAGQAIDELEELFTESGFGRPDGERMRRAAIDPSVPVDALVTLLTGLKQWSAPVTEALLDDPAPHARVAAVRAGTTFLDPEFLLRLARDPDPAVREAAVAGLTAHRTRLPQAEGVIARALRDPVPEVRIAAGSLSGFLRDPAVSEKVAERI